MAKISTLKDREGTSLYPITSSQAVLDTNGIDLETRLNGKVDKASGKGLSSNDYTNSDKDKLTALPTNEQLAEQFNNKQNKLADSEDVTVNGNKLSVTEEAKMKLFVDMWNEACGSYGTYNEETGYFELNGLTDITYQQALAIYNATAGAPTMSTSEAILAHLPDLVRTHLPLRTYYQSPLTRTFFYSFGLEKIVIPKYYSDRAVIRTMNESFTYCTKLESIEPILDVTPIDNINNAFMHCYKLQTVWLKNIKLGLSFQSSPLLSFQSLQYIVANSANTSAITITVHPDVYAKLTGDTSNAAAAALSAEELAQWMALVEAAAEKNIQFATV